MKASKLSIDAYFAELQQIVSQAAIVMYHDVHMSIRGENVGFIRGEVTFLDGSMLHFREYVDAEAGVVRLMYSYHFMDVGDQLIFRYDNADHHRNLALPTHPHHKHDGSEESVLASSAPTFADVLAEIAQIVALD